MQLRASAGHCKDMEWACIRVLLLRQRVWQSCQLEPASEHLCRFYIERIQMQELWLHCYL